MDINDLRKEYNRLSKLYKLPDFIYLNERFEIEKIERESGCLLRVIRKVMMEKIINSLNFIELLINPVNAPRMYFAYARTISADERKSIEEIYAAFTELSILSIEMEIDYSERKEAEAIKKISEVWNTQMPKFKTILSNMKKPAAISAKKEKSYFG